MATNHIDVALLMKPANQHYITRFKAMIHSRPILKSQTILFMISKSKRKVFMTSKSDYWKHFGPKRNTSDVYKQFINGDFGSQFTGDKIPLNKVNLLCKPC